MRSGCPGGLTCFQAPDRAESQDQSAPSCHPDWWPCPQPPSPARSVFLRGPALAVLFCSFGEALGSEWAQAHVSGSQDTSGWRGRACAPSGLRGSGGPPRRGCAPTLAPPEPGLLAAPRASLSLPLLPQACWASRMMGTSSPWSSTTETRGGSPSLTSASCLPTIRSSVSGGPTPQLGRPQARALLPSDPGSGLCLPFGPFAPTGDGVGGAPRTGSDEGTPGSPSFRDPRPRLRGAGCTCRQLRAASVGSVVFSCVWKCCPL